MRRAILALGSNLGMRRQFLQTAIISLKEHGLVKTSGLYETDPVGGPDNQGPYLNMVVELETDASAQELLQLCWALEADAGRERKERWGPRTLDVDILWIDGEQIDKPGLTVPHPRMYERAFVMVPLGDIAPDLVQDWDQTGNEGIRKVQDL